MCCAHAHTHTHTRPRHPARFRTLTRVRFPMLSGSEPSSPLPTSPSRPRDKSSPTTCSPPFPSAAQVTPNHASSTSHGSVGAPPASSSVLQPAVRIHEVGPPVAKYRSESAASSAAGTEQAAGTRTRAAKKSQARRRSMVRTPVGRRWMSRFARRCAARAIGAPDQCGLGAHSGSLRRLGAGRRAGESGGGSWQSWQFSSRHSSQGLHGHWSHRASSGHWENCCPLPS